MHFSTPPTAGEPVAGGVHGMLTGARQTVPRAELTMATRVLERSIGDVCIVTDCKLVMAGFERGPGARPKARLASDWAAFWNAWRAHAESVKMRWTKAHATARDIRAGHGRDIPQTNPTGLTWPYSLTKTPA